MKNRYKSHSTLQSLLHPSELYRITRLADLVERSYEPVDSDYPEDLTSECFEERDALSLQFTPYYVMLDILSSQKRAETLFFEAGRGCCGIDSEHTYPTLQHFKAVAKGDTPAECFADWCSKYWKQVKDQILRVVSKEGIDETAIDAICSSEQYTDDPVWFKWNDIEGCIAKGIQILRIQKELEHQLNAIMETTTQYAIELF